MDEAKHSISIPEKCFRVSNLVFPQKRQLDFFFRRMPYFSWPDDKMLPSPRRFPANISNWGTGRRQQRNVLLFSSSSSSSAWLCSKAEEKPPTLTAWRVICQILTNKKNRINIFELRTAFKHFLGNIRYISFGRFHTIFSLFLLFISFSLGMPPVTAPPLPRKWVVVDNFASPSQTTPPPISQREKNRLIYSKSGGRETFQLVRVKKILFGKRNNFLYFNFALFWMFVFRRRERRHNNYQNTT